MTRMMCHAAAALPPPSPVQVRFRHYLLFSVILTASAVFYAFHTRKHFYNASIFMTTNKLNIMVRCGWAGRASRRAERVDRFVDRRSVPGGTQLI